MHIMHGDITGVSPELPKHFLETDEPVGEYID
jgi:hypothetical protein